MSTPPPPATKTATASLTAHYTSPSDFHTFSSALPALPTDPDSVQEKTAFISAVRASVSQMQNSVNVYLTNKMGQDKAQETASSTDKKSARDEDREEDMYGEEDVGEE